MGRPELRKPVDVGNGLAVASLDGQGRLLSLTTADPRAGVVELTAGPRFDESCRGQPAEVRRYRERLASPEDAVLTMWLDRESPQDRRIVLGDGTEPRWVRSGYRWCCRTVACAPPQLYRTVLRSVLITRGSGSGVITFGGHIGRPAFAEITEIGSEPPGLTVSGLRIRGDRAEVVAPGLHALAAAIVTVTGASNGSWEDRGDHAALRVTWPATAVRIGIEIRVGLHIADASGPARPRPAGRPAAAPASRNRAPCPVGRPLGRPSRLPRSGPAQRIIDGAVRYSRDCAALVVGPGECCLVADHRLLPLSWTRDAYYQAVLLLLAGGDRGRDVVARHLRWLWGPAFTTGGWRRSHLVTGQPRDLARQPDQQLYPIVELLDYRRVTGQWPAAPTRGSWPDLVRRAWYSLGEAAPGLVAAEENPADDAASLPYGLSTQILRWYTASRLAAMAAELDLPATDLARTAELVRSAVHAHFSSTGPRGRQWAYESDGGAARRLYHDANDLPTALAPVFGFCSPDDPQWRATMRFAFSTGNPGYVAGRLGGLGSLHTPGVWPLGDVQEWTWAWLTGDRARSDHVLRRLERVAGLDGMLPESYHPESGQWLARHWFAWPGAAFGAVYLLRPGARHPWRP